MSAIALLALVAGVAAAAPDGLVITRAEDTRWQALNPARGDASPQAGTHHGDLRADTATGFVLHPVDGFSSPPHIHNVSYRGVVIQGEVHNDDPGAAPMWMPPGSFWTQPRGEAHITAARGADVRAWIEVDAGPYRVAPADQATDSGERPLNLHADNMVWRAEPGVERAALWADGGAGGDMLRIPAGGRFELPARGAGQLVVVVAGRPAIPAAGAPLDPGSSVRAPAGSPIPLACAADAPCMAYHRWDADAP